MKWEPMRDRLFVRRMDEPERGFIVIPEKYKDAAHIGEVICVGPKVHDVKPGDRVAFGRFTDYDQDGIVLIQEADIMFKIAKAVKIGIDKFTHNEVGVERSAGSLESMFDQS
jgi:co-chaperonin GroES (HSP10)